MNIISASKTLDIRDRMAVYRITDPNSTLNMKELVPHESNVCTAWLHCEDTNPETGEMIEKVFIQTEDGVYATISPSFIRQFKDFMSGNADGEDLSEFRVIERKTKAGRTCILFSPLSVKEVG